MKSYILVVLFVILLCTEAAMVHGDDKGNKGDGNNGNGNGKNNGEDNRKNKGDNNKDENKGNGNNDEVDYDNLSPSESGQELQGKRRFLPEDPWRKPKCDGYGSLCYDPRFVGGDGVMFYFHEAKDGNFAIVSDDKLQINAHFIGTRPQGRTRDFTWAQALAVMFDTPTLVIAANRVSHWDGNVDAFSVRWESEAVNIPYDEEAEWRTRGEEREVLIERTDDKNCVQVKVSRLVKIDIRVRPIGKEENQVHNYQLPDDDAFAHLETQFKFTNPSDLVEGVLGKTYRPDYVSPVKRGVPMPMMGGEDKYQTPSLFFTSLQGLQVSETIWSCQHLKSFSPC